MKNSRPFIELFQWTKRYAGKIPEYGDKKNPVYWLKRNQHMAGKKIPANNCFKFGKLA